MNLEQSKSKYNDYLSSHIANVKKAYQWLVDNHLLDDIFTSDAIADAKKYVDAHDASKYDPEEYNGYRQYFDPTDKEISTDAPAYERPGGPPHGDREIFKYSWLHHSHKNPHHWEHHLLMNEDEPGKVVALLMPEPYVIEMLSDWLSFSIAKGDPTEIIDWYNEKKSGLILHPSTRHDVERVLKKIADINKMEFTTLDESYSNLHLNSAIWDGKGCLVNGVADKIKEIANQVIDDLKDNGIPIRLIDIWIVGSNAAYNYSEHSDLDIHLIVDMSVSDNPQLLRTVYDYYKSSFNDKYDITIKGLNVEVYLEDMNTTSISKGIFSVGQDKWLRVPVPDDYVYEVNLEPELSNLKSEYMDLIAQDDKDKLQEFLDRLYICRKVSLAEDGEFGKLNLIFKEFRNLGYIDSIKSKINELTSKELSLESKGVKSMKKSITEFWDFRYLDDKDIIYYRDIPIQPTEVKFKDERDDDWRYSTAYYIMDPKNPKEYHPDLWDDWSMDLDSVKAKIDEYLGDKSESLNESLYSMLVKCNDGPTIRVKTIASSEDEAQKFAKNMYASEHTTYADDRENKWEITEIHKLDSQEGSGMSKLNEGRMSEIDLLLTQYKELEDALKTHDFDDPHEGDAISIEMADLRSEIPNFEEFYKQKFGNNSLNYQVNNNSESYDESESEEAKYYGLFQRGGSIGASQGAYNSHNGLLYAVYDSAHIEDAKARAKRLRKYLSPGEKSYYGMGYVVKPLTKYDLSNEIVKNMVSTKLNESYDSNESGALDYLADARDYVKSGNIAAAKDALDNASKILSGLNASNSHKLSFIAIDELEGKDITNTLVDTVARVGVDYDTAKKSAGKYYINIHGTGEDVRKAKIAIEGSGFFKEWVTESITESEEDIYGVHHFDSGSILFKGTSEECGKYITDHKLEDEAEIYDLSSSKVNESSDEEDKIDWEYVSSKTVYDDAGFTDEYYWYKGILPDGTEKHIFMYGDDEPDDRYADWECDSEKEAQDWFDNYEGTYEESVVEGLLDKFKNVFSKKGGKDSKVHKYGLYNDFGRLVYGPFDSEDEAEYELNQKAKMSQKYADTLRVYPVIEGVDLDSPDAKVDYEVEYITADNHHESQFYYTKAHNAGEALENCMKDHPGVDVVDVERLGEAPVEESLDELTEATVEVDGDEIVIKGVKGEERFKPINGDPEKTKHSFDGIMKHSVGRAWQWLKKQKPTVTESIEGEVPNAPTGEDADIVTSLNKLINEELTASDSYLSAIQYYRASGHEDIAKMLEEVRADEESHVGILYKAKTLLDAQSAVGFDSGVDEASKSLEDEVPQDEVVSVVTEAKVDEIDQNEAKLVTQYRDYDNRMRDYELNHKAWLDDMSRGEEPKEPEKFDGFDKKVYEILKSNGFTSTKISSYTESKMVRESKFSDEESIDYLAGIDVKKLSADEISDLNKLFSYFGADFGIRSTYAELPSKELSMLANIASDYLGDDTDDDYVRKFTDGSAGGRKPEVTMTGVLNALGESLDFDDVEVTPNIEGDVNIDIDLELDDEDTPIDPDLDLDDKVDSPIPQFLNNNSIEDDEFNDVDGKKKFLDDQGKTPDLEECDEGSYSDDPDNAHIPSDPDHLDDEEFEDGDDEFEDRFESEIGEATEDKVSYSDLVASAGEILSKEESLMEVADYKNSEDLYAEIKKYADKGNEEAQYLVDLYNTPRSQREFIREARAFLKAKKDAKKSK